MTLSEPLILYFALTSMTWCCLVVTVILVVGGLNGHPSDVFAIAVGSGVAAILGLMLLFGSEQAWTGGLALVLGTIVGVLAGLRLYVPDLWKD